jgi:hypothetical protein
MMKDAEFHPWPTFPQILDSLLTAPLRPNFEIQARWLGLRLGQGVAALVRAFRSDTEDAGKLDPVRVSRGTRNGHGRSCRRRGAAGVPIAAEVGGNNKDVSFLCHDPLR